MIDVRLLGPVQATDQGRPILLGAPKERAVLAILALCAPATVPIDRIIEGLWGDHPPASAVKLVQLYVSHLRRALGENGVAIVTHKHGYALALAPEAVDVHRFERLVQGAAHDGGAGAREALELWRGEPFEDVIDEPFAPAEARRLEGLRVKAAEFAVDTDLAAGRCEDALLELEELVRAHPLREHLHAQRMRALYACGRQAEALDAYAHARRVLDDEVGLVPGAELRDLQRAILAQDPELDPPRPPPRHGSPSAPPAAGGPWRRLAATALLLVVVAGAAALIAAGDGADGRRLGEDVAGLVDPGSGRVASHYAVGTDPRALVAGAGSIWATSGQDGTVSRIDLRRGLDITIDAGYELGAAAFADDSLWVARGNGTIARIDARSNKVIRLIDVGSPPAGVAAGGGAVWVTTPLNGRTLRIDLASGRLTTTTVGAGAGAVAAGATGAWVALQDAGTVVRLGRHTGEVVQTVGVGRGPAALAVTPGAVWVANHDDGTVSRIDPDRNRVTATVSVGGDPVALAADGDTVWVGLGEQRRIVAVSADTGQLRSSFGTTGSPAGLALLGGELWAAAGASAAAHRGGTLRVQPDTVDLDPAVGGYEPTSMLFLAVVHNGLVAYRRAGGTAGYSLHGDLATSVPAPARGGRSYTFTLRRGLRFSDGTPVRASDVRHSLERLYHVGGDTVPPLYGAIRGVGRCTRAPTRCELRSGVVTNDAARTVTLRLARPDPALPYALALPLASVVRPVAGLRLPLGTGPYRVARASGEEEVLVRNRAFREWSPVTTPDGLVDRIRIERGSAPAERIARGDLDLVPQVSPISAGIVARYAPFVRSAPYAMLDYAFLDTRRPPFDRITARRAVALAVDRRLAAARTGGEPAASPSCQVLPAGFPGYRPVCLHTLAPGPSGVWLAPDLPRARRLVAASGTEGARVTVWTGPRTGAYATHMVTVLRELGYRPVLRRFRDEHGYYTAINGSRRPDVGFDGWIADDPRPDNFMHALVGCRPMNRSRFCDRRLDAAIAHAGAEPGAPSATAWSRIERRIARLAPIVPLDDRRSVAIAGRRVGNLVFHPLTGLMLDRVWVR